MCANGIVCHLHGPFKRWRHDAGILKETQLYQNLEKITMGHKYVIYGDPAAAVAVQALWRRRPAATSRCLQQGHEWLET
ncbi:hypothetical protein V5799_017354 [Amblyomma americanum]|uniref:Uncharacterized protein n=1 Tax=Amblyomma americanum TaxID=6943 RepID=A0AAQ4F2D8_AMBAM